MANFTGTQSERVARDAGHDVRLRLIGLAGVAIAFVLAILAWVAHASVVNHWLAVHTGTINESGPYYGFWSGFGSDIAELGILGAICTGSYQLVKKYNCHEPGCWRVGTHPAADGQFLLCYRHHPDFEGKKPTHEMIERLHKQHVAQRDALHDRMHEIHAQLSGHATEANDPATGGITVATPGTQ
jgi:hypothetical protein